MNTKKLAVAVAFALMLGALVFAITSGDTTSRTRAQGGNAEPEACPTPQKNWRTKGNCSMNPSTYFLGTTDNQPLVVKTNSTERMRIDTSGNVGIGTTTSSHRLTVRGPDTAGSTAAVRVENSAGASGLVVYDDKTVQIGATYGSTATHACYNTSGGSYIFAGCSPAAAEYVPTIDSGSGFPETADVVSLSPGVTNPYGDSHSPFAVQKSSTACDANLLGSISDSQLGADGNKVNEHYLPLAVSGDLPVKVTIENGVIHRGDPLTSSSKAGYAMKATAACKIIGYALEDVNAEGTIQVFAHLGANTAPELASLRLQVDALTEENHTLRQELSTMDVRLSALEQTPRETQVTSAQLATPDTRSLVTWVLMGVVALVGAWMGRRAPK